MGIFHRSVATADLALDVLIVPQRLQLQKPICHQPPLGSASLSFEAQSVPSPPLVIKTEARELLLTHPSPYINPLPLQQIIQPCVGFSYRLVLDSPLFLSHPVCPPPASSAVGPTKICVGSSDLSHYVLAVSCKIPFKLCLGCWGASHGCKDVGRDAAPSTDTLRCLSTEPQWHSSYCRIQEWLLEAVRVTRLLYHALSSRLQFWQLVSSPSTCNASEAVHRSFSNGGWLCFGMDDSLCLLLLSSAWWSLHSEPPSSLCVHCMHLEAALWDWHWSEEASFWENNKFRGGNQKLPKGTKLRPPMNPGTSDT